jgi:hypothetical protein
METRKHTTFLEISEARYLDGYRLLLKFNTGEMKVVDLKNELNGEVFLPLRNMDYFKQFKIVYNTVEWPNGADFAPEYLYGLTDEVLETYLAAESEFEYKTKK